MDRRASMVMAHPTGDDLIAFNLVVLSARLTIGPQKSPRRASSRPPRSAEVD
jgi:hypothetical protein